MAKEPIDDIIAWSTTLPLWRQDCLRRLAISNELTDTDREELLAMVKVAAGLATEGEPPIPTPFAKEHFGGSKQAPIILKGIANVEGVNRLVAKASLSFCPKALTIVYGRNGSGKSGFVRILRTACRTRIENPVTLKVFGDVYGDGSGVQAADIVIDAGAGDEPIAWTAGMAAAPQLMQVSVFDSASAQLYVDSGNQIRFLPFGLALPHRLNAACLELKAMLEAEHLATVGGKIELSAITFAPVRDTTPQRFASAINSKTTDLEIETATKFSDTDATRIDEIAGILASGSTARADLATLLSWVEAVAEECRSALTALSDEPLAALTALKERAIAARRAAEVSAGALFDDEPLDGVGSESWRALWVAARNYSLAEAYPGQDFPVVNQDVDAACVLCQQPLLPEGVDRMQRFQAYMDDTLDKAASLDEEALAAAKEALPTLAKLRADDFPERLEQVRSRDADLADKLSAFERAVADRLADATVRLDGGESSPVAELVSPVADVEALAVKLGVEKEQLSLAEDAAWRDKLAAEKAELEDQKILNANKAKLTTRRDLMVLDGAFTKAISSCVTTGITKRANELIDAHLSSAVVARFERECDGLDISNLKVSLARKSGQLKAEFQIDPKTKLTRVTSQILSEGEQRALALASFLTEVALTDGSGPIIVDDPVSSLDRDRSSRVAERIAQEATQRQVIVFTHDIVFFNELCRAADAVGIEPVTVALFSDQDAAGKIDPAGMVWKGLDVFKRIGQIKVRLAVLRKLSANSPADYEYEIKGLYGRLRDTYERMVEEVIFRNIVRRGTDVIQTQLLRYVTLPDALAIRFHEGMTRANTHSHDNPASDTVPVPTPEEFAAHLADLESLIADFNAAKEETEAARPQMKPRK
ncbi:AAA family ATPase [Acidocella sp. KAb 2-4]|uniref:AAA family ATPase n=1 Tax=Acidocella sp. KAb 2-4 TaxID=2885158 RepID=UPI001D07450D|nr:AAA family ATPase [Acidocella sp. KAb 2-4]MCB5943954.1 AAA family ATPase [Acidocella sp. KAb 2-4]